MGSQSFAQDNAETGIRSVSVHPCPAQGACRTAPAFAIQPGGRYGFRVGYTLAGTALVSHLFTFQNAKGDDKTISGLRGGELHHHSAARLVRAGDRREELRLTVPEHWPPGVYQVSYEVKVRPANDPDNPSTYSGARSFLVLSSAP